MGAIFTDDHLGDFGGASHFFEELAEDGVRLTHLPLIVYTGTNEINPFATTTFNRNIFDQMKMGYFDAGFKSVEIFQKPRDTKELVAVVRRILATEK